MTTSEFHYQVAVVGAGPAGLYAARELAQNGALVALFNRDIKPGGLAEYGIYFDKYAMKSGLRRQFRSILQTPGVHYFGNVTVGKNGDLSLDDLRDLGFQAVLVTAGAQGTKSLGLEGETLPRVYHAKDVVYHYNLLPPWSTWVFEFGRHAVVVGAGNVMVDIAHYLVHEKQLETVTALVRRGPAEVKFTQKELGYVIANLDRDDFEQELERVRPLMEAVGQDVAAARDFILGAEKYVAESHSPTRFRFRFLVSPRRILGDAVNGVQAVELEENRLEKVAGEPKARGTGRLVQLPTDSVVFAIGDRVDENLGLPVAGAAYVKSPQPRFPVEGHSYEAWDPQRQQPIEGVFVAGWSREASSGLVGTARKDGINGAKAMLMWLETRSPTNPDLTPLEARLATLGKPVVRNAQVEQLYQLEAEEARKRGLPDFKFASNDAMLQALGLA